MIDLHEAAERLDVVYTHYSDLLLLISEFYMLLPGQWFWLICFTAWDFASNVSSLILGRL